MKVKSLSLTNFRNIDNLNLEFKDGVNVIYGDNAQGKTNIIEAISLFVKNKSFRTSHERDLVKIGCEFSKLELVYETARRENKAEITFKKGKKEVTLNGLPVKDALKLKNFACKL
jgi:DNA replication and repair protein RecF